MTELLPKRLLCQLCVLFAAAIAFAGLPPERCAAQTPSNTFGGLSKNSNQPIDIESDVLVVHDSQKYATFKGNVKAVQGTTTLRSKELDVHYVGGGDSLTSGAGPKAGAAANKQGAGQDGSASATAEGAPAVASKVANADPKAADPKAADPKPADPKAAGGGALGSNGTQISKIEARGDVIITSDQDQTTTSDWALYDVPTQTVTVGGNVVLMQGKNVLKGDRLVIDLKTGESRFENTGNAAAGNRIRALFMPKQDGASEGAKTGNGQSGTEKSADEKSGNGSTGTEKSGNDKSANDKAADDGETNAESTPWQLVPGQQP
jgi:lipopolysaccharide export system protein LptA